MTDVLFRRVDFDDAADPVRIEYTWWEDISAARRMTFGLWITSLDGVRRQVLLVVEREPRGSTTTYLHDVTTGERTPAGSVAHLSPGRLVAEFPRTLITGYGPAVRWWAQARVDEENLDTYVDDDADTRVLDS